MIDLNVTINFNGHNGFPTEPVLLNDVLSSDPWEYNITIKWLEEIIRSSRGRCSYCGENLIALSNHENTYMEIHHEKDLPYNVCAFANFKQYDVKIKIPSGTIVFGNDFRKLVIEKEKENIEVNTQRGTLQYSQLYAKYNLALVFVGNTSPVIYQISDEYGILGYSEVLETGKCHPCRGTVITDLWWFSAMDLDEFIAQGGDRLDYNISEVSVTPGVYEFTSYVRSTIYDTEQDGIVASFRQVKQ